MSLLPSLWCSGRDVAVDGGGCSLEGSGDLRDRGTGVVELLGLFDLLRGEPWGPSTGLAAGAGGGKIVVCGGKLEFTVQAGEDGHHAEKVAPFDGVAVDALFDGMDPDAAVSQVGANDDEVLDGIEEPVQPGDRDGVTEAELGQQEVPLVPGGFVAVRALDVDVLLGDAGPH